MYKVIYLWRGERHVAGEYEFLHEAREVLAEMRAEKWHAWIEGRA